MTSLPSNDGSTNFPSIVERPNPWGLKGDTVSIGFEKGTVIHEGNAYGVYRLDKAAIM